SHRLARPSCGASASFPWLYRAQRHQSRQYLSPQPCHVRALRQELRPPQGYRHSRLMWSTRWLPQPLCRARTCPGLRSPPLPRSSCRLQMSPVTRPCLSACAANARAWHGLSPCLPTVFSMIGHCVRWPHTSPRAVRVCCRFTVLVRPRRASTERFFSGSFVTTWPETRGREDRGVTLQYTIRQYAPLGASG